MARIAGNKILIQFRLTKEEKEKLDEICNEKMINRSMLLRRLTLDWIKENEGQPNE